MHIYLKACKDLNKFTTQIRSTERTNYFVQFVSNQFKQLVLI